MGGSEECSHGETMVMEPMHVSAMEANWNKGVRGHLSLQNFFSMGGCVEAGHTAVI